MKYDKRKIIVNGLVAGVAVNICALGLIPIVGSEMDTLLESFSLPPLGMVAMVFFPVWSLVLGLVISWLYIHFYEATKSTIKTIMMVSLLVWYLGYFSSNVALVVYGFMPFTLALIGTMWGLLEVILASTIVSLLNRRR